jgi:alpha-mannosidase
LFHELFSRRRAVAAIGLLLLAWGTRPSGLSDTGRAGQSAASRQATAQAAPVPAEWTPGFANEISGEVISYPSAYPGQLRTLLTRATDGKMRIEWEAQAPAPGAPDDLVHYIWHAGLASGYGAHRFTLSVNGTPCAVFNSGRDTNDREWSISTACGGTLSFRTTKVGNFNELFGLMMLSVPRRLVAAGRPRFAAVGEAADNQDYYLVFMQPLEEFVRVVAEQAVLKGGRRPLRVEISRIANAQPVRVLSGKAVLWSGTIGPGYTSLFVPLPAASATNGVGADFRTDKNVSQNGGRGNQPRPHITVEANGRAVFSTTVALKPVRPWKVHLLPHSHVDIGYSDPQSEVERKQWKNLKDAVELAARTAAYPPAARFKWNVEGLWSVESYLRQALETERRAFVDAVKRGSIGLQANYTNILTGLASPEELAHWTDAARQLRAAYGFGPIRSAMHTDIPGLSWASVQPLAEGGVHYFSSGPNYMPSLPDGGDRIGGTLKALGDKPFWWVSPSGNERILFWMAGRGYSWFHGMNMGAIMKSGRTPILDYVRQLNDAGYQWNMVQVRYTVGGDNGPVDPALPDAVKEWNDTFESPKLVINTAEAMFAEFERRYGAKLPRMAGDMTPYWEDGAVSSAAEEALVRASARRLVQAETLWCLRSARSFPSADALEAWRNVLLWHEHTWGAADSISQPDRADVVAQWTYKRQFAVEADKRSAALMEGATSQYAKGVAVNAIEVANTLSWPRSGVVFLPADLSRGLDAVTDSRLRPVPSQRLKDGRLAVLVASVPPLGSVRFTLRDGAAAPPRAPVKANGVSLDNGIVQVSVDSGTGDIRRLRATSAPGSEFADTDAKDGAAPGLNAYRYVSGRDPATAKAPGAARVTLEEAGPLVATLKVEQADVPGARSLVRRVTLVAGAGSAAVESTIDKTLVRTKESAHLAFPFNVPNATIRVDEGGAIVVPERDQLPGSCRDFIGVHSAIDVSNRTFGVSLASLDAPLIELGAMTDETRDPKARVRGWRTRTAPGSTVYAYLLNNYWHTNYKADQEGPLTFRFAMRPHAGGEDEVPLRRFGAEQEQPLVAYAVGAGVAPAHAPFRVEGAGVVVPSVRAEAETGALLVRLYNASSRPATARVSASTRGVPIRAEVVTAPQPPPASQGGGPRAATAANPSRIMTMPGVKLAPFATLLVRVRVR